MLRRYGTPLRSQLSDLAEGVLLVYHKRFFLLLTFLHVVQHVHNLFGLLCGGPNVGERLQVLQLLGAHIRKQLILLLPRGLQSWVDVRGFLLAGQRGRLCALNHLAVLSLNFLVESLFHVLCLEQEVLLLLFAVSEELEVLPDILLA